MLTSTNGGSRDTDVKALTVVAESTPSCSVLATVTPLAKRPSAALNAGPSTAPESDSSAGTRQA